MLRRCYSDKYHKKRPKYIGCTVCDKWIKLSGFAEDLPYIEGYEMWLNGYKNRVALDKDTIICGNKVYSKERCRFLSASDNSREGQFRNGRQRQIVRISDDGSIKIYESTIAPQHEDGFLQSRVYQCCANKENTYSGYKWMFLDEHEKFEA